MDLNLAKTFVLVAETRSFTAAAKSLGVPTSSVSRAIGRLETELGAKLLLRTTRRTSLSAAGRVFLEHARKAIAELSEGERRVGELLGELRGEIRMTAPLNLDDGFFARQLVAFTREHPQVRLTVVPTNRVVDLVEEGFDLALRAEPEARGSDVLLRELGRFHAWIVAARSYVAARGRPKRPRDLADHDCVGMRPVNGVSRWPIVGPGGAVETVEVRGPIAAYDMKLAQQLVESGAGIGTLVFAPGASVELAPGLVRVLPSYHVQGPGLFVATPSKRKNLPLRVTALRDFLVHVYARAQSRASPLSPASPASPALT